MERFDHGGDIYGNPGITLDFSVNTNPLGMPDTVRRALISHVDEFSKYPDPHCRELCAAIARYENVRPDWVVCGNGAADLIYRLCYAVKPNQALVCAPTFSEYERALEQVGCRTTHNTLTKENGFALTGEIVEQLIPDTDILFLCNPNNPTGRLIPEDLMVRILKKAQVTRTTVVVDECFLDFTDGKSAKRYMEEMPGLVILKAFTKIYAMAGLRLGYILNSDPGLHDKIVSAAQCWSVSVPAQIAGVAALSCTGWIEKTRRLVSEERHFLSESLSGFEIEVFTSDANFLLMRSECPLYEPLLKKGFLVRSCGNFNGLDSSHFRIGVKTHEDNSRLINAIREVCEIERRGHNNG